jgi:hypothetical protein
MFDASLYIKVASVSSYMNVCTNYCLNTNSLHAGRGPLEKLVVPQVVKDYPTSTEFASDPYPEPEDFINNHPIN